MQNSQALDVIIPVRLEAAYFNFLPICIEGVTRNVQDYIRSIVVVADSSITSHPHFPFHEKVRFIDESLFKKRLYQANGVTIESVPHLETNWFWQQVIKLSVNSLTDAENFLIVDADLLFIKPIRFLAGRTFYFYSENEHYPAYFNLIRHLTGLEKAIDKSFISDHMLFNRTVLRELQYFVESKTKKNFLVAINDLLAEGTPENFFSLSEYELYGTFFVHKYADLIADIIDCPNQGLLHFYLSKPENWSYSEIKSSLNHNHLFIPMISEHQESHEPAELTIRKLADWRKL